MQMTRNENASSDREIRITAAMYAGRPIVLEHLRKHGRLPDNIPMGGAATQLRILLERRGPDLVLTPDEQEIYDAILRERRLPGGRAVLVDEDVT